MSSSSKAGLGCLIAFLTPFLLVGVGGIGMAIQGLVEGDLAKAGGAALFGVIFGGVALVLLVAGRAGHAKQVEQEQNQAAFPDEPWNWRPEWLSGRIESSSRALMITSALFATFWNLLSWPAAILAARDMGADPKLLLVLLFPAVGTGLAVWAIRETMRFRKFGVSVFELAHVPGVIGRGIGGLLRTTVPFHPAEGFRVQLSCVRRVTTGSGKHKSTREEVLWQESETVTETVDDPDGTGVMVPIAFKIPADARPSDDSNSRDVLVWRLEAEADVPGVDYKAIFEVPVFKTADTVRAVAEARTEAAEPVAPAEPFAQPPESKIRVRHYGRGVEIDFPAARHPGTAFALTIFFAIWTGIVVVLRTVGAPLLFPIVFGLVDLLLFVVVVSMWFGVTSVRVSGDHLVLAKGLIFPWRVRSYPGRDFERAFVKRGMQSGNRIYYDLYVVMGGKKRQVASSLKRKREAEWLATVITDAIKGTA